MIVTLSVSGIHEEEEKPDFRILSLLIMSSLGPFASAIKGTEYKSMSSSLVCLPLPCHKRVALSVSSAQVFHVGGDSVCDNFNPISVFLATDTRLMLSSALFTGIPATNRYSGSTPFAALYCVHSGANQATSTPPLLVGGVLAVCVCN